MRTNVLNLCNRLQTMHIILMGKKKFSRGRCKPINFLFTIKLQLPNSINCIIFHFQDLYESINQMCQSQQSGFAPSKDPDQPGHSIRLIRVFSVCSIGSFLKPSFRCATSNAFNQSGWMSKMPMFVTECKVYLLVFSRI